jgi:hypothetical protein
MKLQWQVTTATASNAACPRPTVNIMRSKAAEVPQTDCRRLQNKIRHSLNGWDPAKGSYISQGQAGSLLNSKYGG